MKRILTHPLLLSALVAVLLYVIFAHLITPPLPKSLLVQYMVFCVIGILMVATFDDAKAKQMGEPIIALLGRPDLRVARTAALVVAVGGVGWLTYGWAKPDLGSPIELRTVHPAPPSTIRIYGKKFNLLKLKNPIRAKFDKGSEELAEAVAEGGELYYKNCIYCHGDLLDGRGHFAASFNPRPANFQDVGTIAQLQESYLFWRITTGGPGLPREGSPWASAMPVWHEMLKEDQVWKIITFLYDYTGHVPRSWELEQTSGAADGQAETAAASDGALDDDAIEAIYTKRCAHCHGEEGDGLGPAAEYMYPAPRDFTLGTFKYKTTHADDEFPTDADLRASIMNGLTGTAMPPWKSILTEAEVTGLIKLIKVFGEWDEEEIEHMAIDDQTPVASSAESIAKGAKIFEKVCVQCHGAKGRGNVTSGKKLKDDWQDRIWPRNLTRPETWRATLTVKDVFHRVSGGIRGTPMPEHTTTMKAEDRWHVANYAMTLRKNAVALSSGETVVRGIRIQGELPTKHDDPAWDAALPITFSMAPNVIKDPRVYFTLNDTVTVRALFNDTDVALRLDVDDRTYSVPGHKDELAYRIKDVAPTRDAVAVQFPMTIPTTSEKPWFRHGDPKHGVNMWYWAAPSVEPALDQTVAVLDADGPNAPPRPRDGETGLTGAGTWADGTWQVVLRRPLKTEHADDLQFEVGKYVPISFANWDGINGEKGGRHSFASWYWLLLEPDVNPAKIYGAPIGAGLLAGLSFVFAARRQRRSFERE